MNEQIRISPVRLIGAAGEQVGVVPTAQALEMAREANLDLVEVAPLERPPVCKILDYGKFRYQQTHKRGPSLKFTDQILKNLQEDELPEQLVEKVKPLAGKNYPTDKEFVDALEKVLAPDELKRYRAKLLEHIKKSKAKTHHQKLKEIRLRPKTGDHDIETKINQARKFLEHKDKVLVNVLFRGRELQHIDEGRRIIAAILEKLTDIAKVEKSPSMEGKRMTAMLAPK